MSETPSPRRVAAESFDNLMTGVECPRGPSDEPLFRYWLDLETGEVIEESSDELLDGQKALLAEVRKLRKRIDAAADRYVQFDPPEPRDEYRRMVDFAESLPDEMARVRLLDALHGRGAFGRFKRMVERVGLRERWFAFLNADQRRIAVEFLEAHGFAPPGA